MSSAGGKNQATHQHQTHNNNTPRHPPPYHENTGEGVQIKQCSLCKSISFFRH